MLWSGEQQQGPAVISSRTFTFPPGTFDRVFHGSDRASVHRRSSVIIIPCFGLNVMRG
jgi:hypothetical protein